jgi:outer membrane protein assembly factor BamA
VNRQRPVWRIVAGAVLALAFATACASIPDGRYAVDAVEFEGVEELDESSVGEAMATRENARFAFVFEGFMNDYSIFDRYVLQEDMARVQRFYQSEGFFETQVRVGAVTIESDDEVAIEVLIEEGGPVFVERVIVEGLEGIPVDLAEDAQLIAEEALPLEDRFREEPFIGAEADIKRLLTDNAYAFAKVRRFVTIDLVRHAVWVRYEVEPGRPATFGEVTIEGAGDLPEDQIRAALAIERGEPYSTTELERAQSDAFALGVFASVSLIPQLPDPPPPALEVPIKVVVTKSKLRSIRLGGGVTIDSLKSDVHLLFGWEGRNFLGDMRRLSVDFQPALVFVPLRINNFVVPDHYLPAAKLRSDFRQPGFIEPRTTFFVRPQISVTPILLKSETAVEDPILGYAESLNAVGVMRSFGRFFVQVSQNVQYALPFPYVGELDPGLTDVLLLFPELVTAIDLRDEKIQPHAGAYFANTFQWAFAREGRDFKVIPEVRGYLPLGESATLAARTKVGFLFPQNYGDGVAESIQTPFDGPDRAERIQDLQVLYFRGFFSGGAASNRGYPYGGVGPHGIVPYLNPTVGICDPNAPDLDLDRCLSPVGGLTLWEASLALRFVISDPLSGAVFCDASDVSPEQTDIRLQRPHLSCGVGARYGTPVGPIRLDVGYRIPGLQSLDDDDPLEKDPGNLLGLPIAIAFGIGEPF